MPPIHDIVAGAHRKTMLLKRNGQADMISKCTHLYPKIKLQTVLYVESNLLASIKVVVILLLENGFIFESSPYGWAAKISKHQGQL